MNLSNIIKRLKGAWKRRHYHLNRWLRPATPPRTVSWLPDGFTVRQLAGTGLSIVDNFCTPAEAAAVIEAARDRLERSGVLIDGKFHEHEGRISYTAELYSRDYQHAALFPLMQRAAALAGVPYTHIDNVYVTRYPEGGLYNEHLDFGDEYQVDRLYTVLLYLNTVPEEQGGATVFPRLNVSVQPRVGRAVTWTNKNPDGSGHYENSHTASPVTNDGEKWVIQFWLRNYPMVPALDSVAVPQARTGQPLSATDVLPDGVQRVPESGPA